MGDDSFARSIPRRKQVLEAYKPNSFRVLTSEDDVRVQPKSSSLGQSSKQTTNILGQPVSVPLTYDPWAFGRPAPLRSRVLHSNVKSMLEPITDVRTEDRLSKTDTWWTHPPPGDKEPSPPTTLDTTSRSDYSRHSRTPGNTRHSSNPNKTQAIGGVPVTWLPPLDGSHRFIREGISYEHQYDSRLDPNYPPRGKRQGNFVWDPIPQEKVDQLLLAHFGYSNRLTSSGDEVAKCSDSGKSRVGLPPSLPHSEAIGQRMETPHTRMEQAPVAL